MSAAPNSILLINIRLIGDVILTTPLVGLLKQRYPEAAIDLLVNRGTGEFLRKHPGIREVLTVRNREFRTSLSGQQRSPHYLRNVFRRYDWAINMNASDRGNFAAILAGRKARLGFSENPPRARNFWKQWGFTQHLPYRDDQHVALRCARVAEALGIRVGQLEVSVPWDSSDESVVDELMAERGVDGAYFVVHPFARWEYKYWKGECFAQVSDYVAERHGLQPVWTSSPDPDECLRLKASAEYTRHRPVQLPGLLTLNQMSYLLSRADGYLGLDTAVTHIAASHGVRMVAVFGPTLLHRWHPWDNRGSLTQSPQGTRGLLSNGRAVVVRKDLPCMPCGTSSCDDQGGPSPCLMELTVDEVKAGVDYCFSSNRNA